jgi:hypothetical protein
MTAPSIGPKKNPMPPMNVNRRTEPERSALTFSALTISKLMALRPPAIHAKNAERISVM